MSAFNRRQFISSAAVLLGAGALSACGSTQHTSSSGSTGSSANPTVYNGSGNLTLWNYASQFVTPINTAFVPSHPQIKLDLVNLAISDLQDRILVSIAAGSGLPDSASLTSRSSDLLFKTGAFEPWTKAELAPLKKGFGDYLVSYEGTVYGLPTNDGRLGFWVNNATLEKYNIDSSTLTTWESLAEAGRKLNTDSGGTNKLFMVPNGSNGADYFSALVGAAGGNWWNAKGEFIQDQSIAEKMLTFVVGLAKDKTIQITDWTQPTFFTLVKQDQLSGFGMNFAIGGINLPKNVPSQSGQWRMLDWPKWKASDPKRTVSYGMTFFGILKGGNTTAAKEFATWCFGSQGLPLMAQAFGSLAYADASKLPTYQQKFDYFGGQQVIADLVAQPMLLPNFFRWSKTEQVVSYAVDQAVLQKMSPSKAIDYIVTNLSKLS